jgi:hypothetical protein
MFCFCVCVFVYFTTRVISWCAHAQVMQFKEQPGWEERNPLWMDWTDPRNYIWNLPRAGSFQQFLRRADIAGLGCVEVFKPNLYGSSIYPSANQDPNAAIRTTGCSGCKPERGPCSPSACPNLVTVFASHLEIKFSLTAKGVTRYKMVKGVYTVACGCGRKGATVACDGNACGPLIKRIRDYQAAYGHSPCTAHHKTAFPSPPLLSSPSPFTMPPSHQHVLATPC